MEQDVDIDYGEHDGHEGTNFACHPARHSKFPGKYLKQKTD